MSSKSKTKISKNSDESSSMIDDESTISDTSEEEEFEEKNLNNEENVEEENIEEEEEEENVEEEGKDEGENVEEEYEDGEYDIETVKDSLIDKSMKSCIYKKNSDESDNSNDDDDVFAFDDEDIQVKSSRMVPPDQRTTKAILTKYERVRLLSDRTTQLTRGAKPMVKNVELLTSKQIAELELKYDVIPLKIRRPLPDNTYEIWWTKELMHDREL